MSDGVRIVGLNHVQIAMPAGGEDAARAFYAGVLGMRELPKPRPLGARGGCWFEAAGVGIHLGVEAGFRPAAKAHPAFRVADLEACRAALSAAGATVVPDDSVPGVRHLYAFDPFGNRLELIQAGDVFPAPGEVGGGG